MADSALRDRRILVVEDERMIVATLSDGALRERYPQARNCPKPSLLAEMERLALSAGRDFDFKVARLV